PGWRARAGSCPWKTYRPKGRSVVESAHYMRCWTTADGTVLVEVEPPADRVNYGPLYREFDTAGALRQTYRPLAYSVQEYLGSYPYRVEHASLIECRTEESDRGGPKVVERRVVSGLTPADSRTLACLEVSLSTAAAAEEAQALELRAQAQAHQSLGERARRK